MDFVVTLAELLCAFVKKFLVLGVPADSIVEPSCLFFVLGLEVARI